jgi:hypothetical protein
LCSAAACSAADMDPRGAGASTLELGSASRAQSVSSRSTPLCVHGLRCCISPGHLSWPLARPAWMITRCASRGDYFPNDESIDITGFLYLYSTANRFRAASLGFGENMMTDNTNDIYYGFPPEVPNDTRARVQTMMRNIAIPVDMPGVWNAVRLAASAFHEVSEAAESVSDILDLAVMFRSDRGVVQGRLLANNTTIISASNEALAAMLQPV